MAVCSNCNTESPRVRLRWDEKGKPLPDQCPHCSPASFDKFSAPSDKKIWMGYEAHPNEYVKSEDGGYDRKPEYRAEQEAKLALQSEDERIAENEVIERKRATRRTEPMTPTELLHAITKARQIAEALNDSSTRVG